MHAGEDFNREAVWPRRDIRQSASIEAEVHRRCSRPTPVISSTVPWERCRAGHRRRSRLSDSGCTTTWGQSDASVSGQDGLHNHGDHHRRTCYILPHDKVNGHPPQRRTLSMGEGGRFRLRMYRKEQVNLSSSGHVNTAMARIDSADISPSTTAFRIGAQFYRRRPPLQQRDDDGKRQQEL